MKPNFLIDFKKEGNILIFDGHTLTGPLNFSSEDNIFQWSKLEPVPSFSTNAMKIVLAYFNHNLSPEMVKEEA